MLINSRIKLQGLPSDPVTPAEGELYYNSTVKKLRYWNGSMWKENNYEYFNVNNANWVIPTIDFTNAAQWNVVRVGNTTTVTSTNMAVDGGNSGGVSPNITATFLTTTFPVGSKSFIYIKFSTTHPQNSSGNTGRLELRFGGYDMTPYWREGFDQSNEYFIILNPDGTVTYFRTMYFSSNSSNPYMPSTVMETFTPANREIELYLWGSWRQYSAYGQQGIGNLTIQYQ